MSEQDQGTPQQGDPSQQQTQRLPVTEQQPAQPPVAPPPAAPQQPQQQPPQPQQRSGSAVPWVITAFAVLLLFLVSVVAAWMVFAQRTQMQRMAVENQRLQMELLAMQNPSDQEQDPDGQSTDSGSDSGGQSSGSGGSDGGSSSSSSSGPQITKESGTNPAEVKDVFSQGGADYIKVDNIQFLTGQEAIDAAVADGQIDPGDPLENDYYVRNQNSKLRTFKVSPSVKVTLWQGQDYAPGDFAGFKAAADNYLWWITVDNGTVTEIKAQYTP